MNRPLIRIANVEREMTDEEYEIYLADLEAEKERQAKISEAKAKRAALLERLGITEEEAKLLLG